MTSPDVSHALLRKLKQVGDDAAGDRLGAFRFALDFDSDLTFPDLPFDPTAPTARYDDAARPGVVQVVEVATGLLRDHATGAFAFVDEALDRAMLRRSGDTPTASSSNRARVGTCVLTNVHLPSDRVFVCIEALVHESVHQYLYRVERDQGDFCDLAAPGRHRSPWSGNRIPLHSLVHACFVYFALVGLWCRLARRLSDAEPIALVRDRLARNLFGFRYLRPLIDAPAFPRERVQPAILEAIGRIVIATGAGDLAPDADRQLSGSLGAAGGEAWLAHLATGLDAVAIDEVSP